MTFVNEGDFISFRCVLHCFAVRFNRVESLTPPVRSHHVFVKTSHKEVQLAEVGPRFEMRRKSMLHIFLSSSR